MAQYLGDAIDSVLKQTMADLEILVIDDGSTDGTSELMARYLGEQRVRYSWQENSGQTRAKNAGIAMARGRFIAFCDADDLWVPEKLAHQLPLFEGSTAIGVVYGRRQRMLSTGELFGEDDEICYRGRITEKLFRANFIPFGTAIVRRSCFEEFGIFDERYRMGIDWHLWLRISTRYEFAFVDAVIYMYRVWPGQMSTNWRGRYDAAFRIMEEFLDEYPSMLPRSVIDEAYAHSYTERARHRSLWGREYWQGIRDVFTALQYRKMYLPAWKLMIRIGVTAVGWPPPQRNGTV